VSINDRSCPWTTKCVRGEEKSLVRGVEVVGFSFSLRPIWSDKTCPSRTNRVRSVSEGGEMLSTGDKIAPWTGKRLSVEASSPARLLTIQWTSPQDRFLHHMRVDLEKA